MEKNVEKRTVPPVLRTMKKGDKELFPIEQIVAIDAAMRRLHTEMMREGAQFKRDIDEENFTVIVTRIA